MEKIWFKNLKFLVKSQNYATENGNFEENYEIVKSKSLFLSQNFNLIWVKENITETTFF